MDNVSWRSVFHTSLNFIKESRVLFRASLLLMSANLCFDIGLAVIQQFFFNDMTAHRFLELERLLTATSVLSLFLVAAITVQYYAQAVAAADGGQRLLLDIFQSTYQAAYHTVTGFHSADVVSRMTEDAGQMVHSVPLLLNGVLYQVVVTTTAFTLLWRLSPGPALLALGAGPIIFSLVEGLIGAFKKIP